MNSTNGIKITIKNTIRKKKNTAPWAPFCGHFSKKAQSVSSFYQLDSVFSGRNTGEDFEVLAGF
jgi:hypothetical protein